MDKFGFLYEPASEGEVYLLFGYLIPYIGEELERLGFPASEYYVEKWTEQPTDIVLRADGRRLRVEFELYSSSFRGKHDPGKCDLIVCWKDNWEGHSLKVLELSRIVREKFPNVTLKPRRGAKQWTHQELMEELRQNLSDSDFNEMSAFFDELKATKGIELTFGKGDRVPTMEVNFTKFGPTVGPLGIEASGRCWIAYFNVNVKPPKPILPEEKAIEIRKLLNEPKRMWHYIKAKDIKDCISKLRQIVKVMMS
jgi:hypothetical protein